MKGSIISLVLTTLLVTSLFQQQQISAASQNNTDQEANECIGLQCLIDIDVEADLFMDQLAAGSSRMLGVAHKPPVVKPTSSPAKAACPAGKVLYQTSCIRTNKLGITNMATKKCDPFNRVGSTPTYPCRR
ncbi:hypothetical protein L195_g051856 [Trifolium pratense]|uniref:Uncharacterized protein n=1 Tax=Trifolium pratense TaxID=57577 RepID=A0A2K3K1X4_TRIPR|nr:hypothetical protein L195_g051856 [Trifolium pratense]